MASRCGAGGNDHCPDRNRAPETCRSPVAYLAVGHLDVTTPDQGALPAMTELHLAPGTDWAELLEHTIATLPEAFEPDGRPRNLIRDS